jgi:hypothetical protein
MNKSAWTINGLNLKNLKAPYIITGVVFLAMLVQDVIKLITASGGGQILISIGNMLWFLIPLAAIFIPAKNFRRAVNLGGKRKSIFTGSLITYLILSGAVSLTSTLIYYTYDNTIINTGAFAGMINLLEVFGWSAHGPVVVILQQFAFLFLLAVFTHTLTSLQDSWLGWTVDILIIAVIAVFTPIAPLHAVLVWFFYLIIFQANALAQILACLVLGGLIYALNLPIFSRKAI